MALEGDTAEDANNDETFGQWGAGAYCQRLKAAAVGSGALLLVQEAVEAVAVCNL